ncbi:MAG: NAD-dependent epimerase/dehydratase family protein [Candidatus Melainabacteria bacterium]|nr:NAD-dependent epimerase/dehydratase family protein [Candidatus Melainabacteria bacterium]
MKILVTGASGFIGCRLVSRLVEAGHYVRTFGRSQVAPPELAKLDIEHISGDIANHEAVLQAVGDCDMVFHLAGLVSYRAADREKQHQANVVGTRNVMEASLNAGVTRVIYTSSIAAMGIPVPGTVGDESITYNLQGLGLNYCDSKHAAEVVALDYAKQGLPVIILCPGIIFGEGDTHPHHRAIFMAMSKGWLIGWPAGGVTFCDIEDVIEAHMNAMSKGRVGERYVLGSANLTYREAAEVLSKVLGSRRPSFEIPGWLLETSGMACEAVFPLVGKPPPLTRQVAWLSQKTIFFTWKKASSELNMPCTAFLETMRRTAPYYLGRSNNQVPASKANQLYC